MSLQQNQRVYLVLSFWLFLVGLSYGDKVTILKEPTKGAKWIWQTNSPWQVINSVYTKCTIGSEGLNYIRTPFIAMPPRVRSIYVTIVYSVKSCSGKEKCSEEFVLKKLEVNESLLHNEIKPERFNDTVKIIRNTNPNGIITDVIPLTVKAGGVYFALVDRSACQTLYSFEVSYKVCPKEGASLLVFDDTPVPASGSQKNVVSGRCVRNSVLAPNASSPKAVCGSNEKWIVDSNLTCFCNPGYQPSTDFKHCLKCQQGLYKASIGNEQCRNCSSNSAPNNNRTSCLCLENYIRIPGELNCTGKPSAPEKLNITSLSESEVTLVWKEPNDTGGRNDVVYGVNCMVYTSFKWEKCPSTVGYNPQNESLKQTKVILSNLQPYTQYKIIISATNGVSKLLSDTNPASKEKVLKTAESRKILLIQEPKNNWKDWVSDFRGTSWSKQTYSENPVFASCSPGSATEGWLLLPFISNVPSSVKTLTAKFIFTFRKCISLDNSTTPCNEQIELLRREEDKTVRISELRKKQFDVAATVTAKQEEMSSVPPVGVGPMSSFSGTVKRGSKKIYLAIKNVGSCIALFSFEVSYVTCPSQGVDLIEFNKTVAPTSGSTEIEVDGSCVSNAVPVQGSSRLYAICHSSGEWTAGVNASCVCIQGYQQSIDQNKCEECPVGTYKDVAANTMCRACPKNSKPNFLRDECVCKTGYYRVPVDRNETSCEECPAGTYKDVAANTMCRACPKNSKPNSLRDECVCKTGYYRVPVDRNETSCEGIPSSPLDARTPFLNVGGRLITVQDGFFYSSSVIVLHFLEQRCFLFR